SCSVRSQRTTFHCFSLMRKISSLSQSFRSVRKFFTSTGYSPTNSVNFDFSAGGYVKSFFTVSGVRSEEHTSELQSRFDLVCRLLLEKKKRPQHNIKGQCSLTVDNINAHKVPIRRPIFTTIQLASITDKTSNIRVIAASRRRIQSVHH